MKQLAWNPAWVQAHESIESIAAKISFVNTALVSDIAALLIGASGVSRGSLWLPEVQGATICCGLLGIDASGAGQHFVRIGASTLRERARVRLALRWCPRCLRDHYHSAIFQDHLRTRCPWHGDPLLEACPSCRSPVDPMRFNGWRCSRCRTPLADPAKNWLTDFKSPLARPLTQEENTRGVSYSTEVSEADESLALVCLDDDALGAEDWAEHHESEERWVQWLAFEEFSAMSDAILGRHSRCLGLEWLASRLEFTPTHFDCPGAAAIANAMAWVGARPQELEGWPDSTPGSEGHFGTLMLAVLKYPRWLVPFVVREIVRTWALDALRVFSSAAASGCYAAEWRPLPPVIGTRSVQRESAVLLNQIPEDALKAAACQANALCRCKAADVHFARWTRCQDVEKTGIAEK